MAKFYAVDANGNSALLSINIQGFTQSLQQNGWCKLPNGLILQWYGYPLSPLDGSITTYNFPISFSVACFGVYKNIGSSIKGSTVTDSYDSAYEISLIDFKTCNGWSYLYSSILAIGY